ncbi:hypothetical protein ABT234_00590 [Streptomyces sp. NPDC001586]|uniref:hypothetical protein n=1 Tax=Streptomyces sp. NPDC001586 TaxID=3154387 RepID=UPI0033304447
MDDVLRAHREVAQQMNERNRGPWLSGSFYVLAVVAITGATIAASRLAPPWTVPLVIVGSLIGVGTVGALQLRHDDRLSERRFLDLMKMTFLNLPALLRRSPPPAEALPIVPNQAGQNGQGTPPI